MSLVSFCCPFKQRTRSFLIIVGGIERDQRHEMGKMKKNLLTSMTKLRLFSSITYFLGLSFNFQSFSFQVYQGLNLLSCCWLNRLNTAYYILIIFKGHGNFRGKIWNRVKLWYYQRRFAYNPTKLLSIDFLLLLFCMTFKV